MEWRADQGGLTAERFERHGFVFRAATAADDEAIAGLINHNAIPGWVDLAYRIKTGAQAPLRHAILHHSVIGSRLSDGRVGGIASRSVHPAFVNAQPARVGWLGQLRIDTEFRNRPHLLRAGFEAVRRFLHDPHATPAYLAAIVADNAVARRILEANLDGFPIFAPLFRCSTIVMRARPRPAGPLRTIRRAAAGDMEAIAAFINERSRVRQFAPRILSHDEFVKGGWPGLAPQDFRIAERAGSIQGVVAVWDQSSARRLVVQRYAPWIARLRPFINLLAPTVGLPSLPAAGSDLRYVYLSLLTVAEDDADMAVALLRSGLSEAARRGAEIGMLCLAESDPLRPAIERRCRHLSYESIIYRVNWQDDDDRRATWDGRVPKLEIGLL